MKFLLADDEIDMIEMLKADLETKGHRVIIAMDGNQAAALMQAEMKSGGGIDTVVIDIRVPGKSAVELTKLSKFLSTRTRVVIISNVTTVELEEAAQEAGADDIVIKPFTISQIIDIIQRPLQLQSG